MLSPHLISQQSLFQVNLNFINLNCNSCIFHHIALHNLFKHSLLWMNIRITSDFHYNKKIPQWILYTWPFCIIIVSLKLLEVESWYIFISVNLQQSGVLKYILLILLGKNSILLKMYISLIIRKTKSFPLYTSNIYVLFCELPFCLLRF